MTSSPSEPVEIPVNVSVSSTKGYVYYNATTEWVSLKSDPDKKHATHKKVIIGKALIIGPNWKDDRRMIPNSNYFHLFEKDKIPEQPLRADNISVGVYAAVKELACDSGLSEELLKVFTEEETALILDLAMYMLTEESAVFQHFPHWGRSHAVFSESVRSDSYICRFQKESISLSKINQFKELWAKRAIDDGKLYFCYDSTNTNSQAEGVFLVQKGHAKDDPSLEQVNTDYVVRQRDGLPVTFTAFPGAIVDMAEATEMLSFFDNLIDKSKQLSITMICDRGYISEKNVTQMDDAGINFLLMLKRRVNVTEELLDKYSGTVRSSAHYLPDSDQYGMTVTGHLFNGDTRTRYFHIIWTSDLETANRKKFFSELDAKEKRLQKIIERKTQLTYDEMYSYAEFFDITATTAGNVPVKVRGQKAASELEEEQSYVINSVSRNIENIDFCIKKLGFRVLVSSEKMNIGEAIEAYSKRDCVEKVFMALKSFLGMKKIGVDSDDSTHTKMLIWFIAAILHSLVFNRTAELRKGDKKADKKADKKGDKKGDKKSFTVPSIIDLLEEISADRNLNTGKYKRRYRPIKKQNCIMKSLGLTIDKIDSYISEL